jgi:hypothetical protein
MVAGFDMTPGAGRRNAVTDPSIGSAGSMHDDPRRSDQRGGTPLSISPERPAAIRTQAACAPAARPIPVPSSCPTVSPNTLVRLLDLGPEGSQNNKEINHVIVN